MPVECIKEQYICEVNNHRKIVSGLVLDIACSLRQFYCLQNGDSPSKPSTPSLLRTKFFSDSQLLLKSVVSLSCIQEIDYLAYNVLLLVGPYLFKQKSFPQPGWWELSRLLGSAEAAQLLHRHSSPHGADREIDSVSSEAELSPTEEQLQPGLLNILQGYLGI